VKGNASALAASRSRAGRTYAEAVPATVDRAKALKAEGLTLRQVANRLASEGHKTKAGTSYQFTAVGRMISGRTR
jgi:hypothetical protein